MLRGLLCVEEELAPQHALAHAVALWQRLDAAEPVLAYGAVLAGDAIVLGAHQRERDALSKAARESSHLARRASGGAALRAGAGVLYFALGLRERSVLMPCPALRILNRNLRGALAGLRKLGLAANYFGRDFVSIGPEPAAYVAWATDTSGRVLVEMFVSHERAFVLPAADDGYPPRTCEPFRGRTPTTLRAAGAKCSARDVLHALASGYASGFGVALRDIEPTPVQQSPAEAGRDDAELCWSAPYEEAIGWISAGVALDAAGKLRSLQLAGDFFVDAGAAEALRRTLIGVEPTEEFVGRGLDAVFARGGHEIEGVRDLGTVRGAILDAGFRARTT